MENDTFVKTELRTHATESLSQEVADEIDTPDPSPDEARAALKEAIEDKDKDGQERED